MTESKTYADWSILELMGHRRLAGYVTEVEIAGKGFLRIDVPGPEDTTTSQLYNPDSVYGLTPTTEAVARAVAKGNVHVPVHRWELPTLTETTRGDVEDDDDFEGE